MDSSGHNSSISPSMNHVTNERNGEFLLSAKAGSWLHPNQMVLKRSAMSENNSLWRVFWDWLVLFSGISTSSNHSRTRHDPVRRRGLFLFRAGKSR